MTKREVGEVGSGVFNQISIRTTKCILRLAPPPRAGLRSVVSDKSEGRFGPAGTRTLGEGSLFKNFKSARIARHSRRELDAAISATEPNVR